MARIFVSSTFKDLEECREKISIHLKQMGHEDITMEYFVAEDKRPLDRCLKDVSSCDLYIGVFAWRYGYTPDGYDKSVTELEYRKAMETGKDCLIFLLHKDAPWPLKFIDKEKDAEKIAALRNELSSKHIISSFRSVDELASLAEAAVRKWEVWIRNFVPEEEMIIKPDLKQSKKPAELLNEIKRATKDEFFDVRCTAIKEIAFGWRDDPETFSILKQVATIDKDSDVRLTAVQELARGWNEDSKTLNLLKQIATEDGS